MSIVISISNLIIVIFVSSSFVSYVCKYRNFVSFGMCAALKKKKKKKEYKSRERWLPVKKSLEFYVTGNAVLQILSLTFSNIGRS